MTLQPSADVELDRPREAVQDKEVWHDASDLCPIPETSIAEASSFQQSSIESNFGNNSSHGHSQSSLATVKAIGTWAAAAVGIGALAVAVYYGYWSLKLQRWSAIKDFREQCQGAKMNNVSTVECIEALSHAPIPPPAIRSVAQRMYNCVTFQDACSESSAFPPALSSRSVPNDKKPWWLVLLQTLVVLVVAFGLHWLGTIPPSTLRSAIQRHFGAGGFQFLRCLQFITYETFVLLSCFSPTYALWFWWINRKRLNFFSIASLTCFGGAFTAFYVYGSRKAWKAQKDGAEDLWQTDPQSIEQQVWTRPDGFRVVALGSGVASRDVFAISSMAEFETGPKRRHR